MTDSNNKKGTGDIDIRIGKKIQQLRMKKGISRYKFAKQLLITHQQLKKYENAVNRITVSRLYEISQILCCSLDYFLCEGDDIKDNEFEHNIVRKLMWIQNPDHKQLVIDIIDALGNK